MSTREENVYLARLAEQGDRYDDMVEFMKEAVYSDPKLTSEERNLLSAAYKNSISDRCASLRTMNRVVERMRREQHHAAINNYKQKIVNELRCICTSVFTLLEEHLLPNASGVECKVFYLKMKGDYKRYLAEFSSDQEKVIVADDCLNAYTSASEIATTELTPTNPVRLGIVLNFSVFYYEILEDHKRACEMATAGFEEAIAVLDKVTDEEYRDATAILQLLRDNLVLWKGGGE